MMLTSKGFKRYLMTGTLESILGRLASHNYQVNNWVVHRNPWSNQVETLCIRCNCYRVENTTWSPIHLPRHLRVFYIALVRFASPQFTYPTTSVSTYYRIGRSTSKTTPKPCPQKIVLRAVRSARNEIHIDADISRELSTTLRCDRR